MFVHVRSLSCTFVHFFNSKFTSYGFALMPSHSFTLFIQHKHTLTTISSMPSSDAFLPPSHLSHYPTTLQSQMDFAGSLSVFENIQAAFQTLQGRVLQALQTQAGDATRLQDARTQVQSLLRAGELVKQPLSLLNISNHTWCLYSTDSSSLPQTMLHSRTALHA